MGLDETYNFEGWMDVDTENLSPDEESGLVLMPGIAVFADLDEMGQVEDYAPKYQITFRVPKGDENMAKLFAVSALIGEKTWKGEAEEKLTVVFDCIDKGVRPNKSSINVQDGDIHLPQYNAGSWVIKASRREDEGMPHLYATDGTPIFDEDGELIGDEREVVKQNDACAILLRVWAQKKRDRINYSLVAVRMVEKGYGTKAFRVAASAQEQNAIAAMASATMTLPALPESIAGDVDEEEEEVTPKRVTKKASKKASKKAASKKKAAKKKAARKGGSVFRK